MGTFIRPSVGTPASTPTAVDAVRAYAARVRADADRLAAVFEDIAPWNPQRPEGRTQPVSL
ncbi:hypothetical protein J7E88_29420 [Streptomyces sp. ISL-10]|uniref:hypothetical protein n=1 Tax=Streptomyces sp. ISL-10 TaxID=2819172 RepID=UPI001BECA6E6|nr:hypothetical protein [Streptomyces sp. ISL-10]MBT2369313.1 hypothetical protein [Streptomyces sp. ISL-10]